MYQGRRRLALKAVVFLALSFTAFYFYDTAETTQNKTPLFVANPQSLNRENVSDIISADVLKNHFPEDVFSKDKVPKRLKVEYTLNQDMQEYSQELLNRYRPDYAAIVLMNAETGEILAMSSFDKHGKYDTNLALKASYPAASIFKVITAATAVDKAGVNPEHRIAFNGGNYTLYKKNVLSDNVNRWTRIITLKDAFARSINTAFGRLSLEKLEPEDLSNYANRFMFNQDIPTDFHVDRSLASIPTEKGYELTEVASGYNRFNTLSPVHGALIASTVVNDGVMPNPFLVKNIYNDKNELVYAGLGENNLDVHRQVISARSAGKMRQLMEQTVLTGTSRKSFRQMVRDRKFREVEMGGKTGHFTGTNPKGRTDWFVGYASDEENKIAIAAITVNIEKWTVKSSALGEMMFRRYFKDVIEERMAQEKQLKEPEDKLTSNRVPVNTPN
jgi:peptidoglycan glycosyltransferase